jgi:hypothetical protein
MTSLPYLFLCGACFYLKDSPGYSLLLLLPTLLFKETAGVTVALLAGFYAWDLFIQRSLTKSTISRWCAPCACISVAGLGVLFAFLTIYIFPHRLWTPTFDPASRIASMSRILSFEVVRAKLFWSLMVAAPLIPFIPLIDGPAKRCALLFLLPALPTLAAIALTDYEPMLNFGNYYAVTPAIFLGLAVSVLARGRDQSFSAALALSLIIATLIYPSNKLTRHLFRDLSHQSAHQELFSVLDPRLSAVVDDYSASILATTNHPVRILHAQRMHFNFDYLVTADFANTALRGKFLKLGAPCHQTGRYKIWCISEASRKEVK